MILWKLTRSDSLLIWQHSDIRKWTDHITTGPCCQQELQLPFILVPPFHSNVISPRLSFLFLTFHCCCSPSLSAFLVRFCIYLLFITCDTHAKHEIKCMYQRICTLMTSTAKCVIFKILKEKKRDY